MVSPIVTVATKLAFHPTELNTIDEVRPILSQSPYRTCDFTIGGIYMWTDYFRYSHAVVDDTLFIKGVSEDDTRRTAYSLPVGELPLSESIPMLIDHCADSGSGLLLSAVPEEAVDELISLGARSVAPLDDWSDYLYEAERMATFTGKKLGKKRNHVNHFRAEFPDAVIEPLTRRNLPAVIEFFKNQGLAADKSITADYERLQVLEVLNHPELFGFEGCVVSVPGRGVVAFTMGEVVGDTLYAHIEKMDHTAAGAGEVVSSAFVRQMKEKYPGLKYVNREEDTGDEGLRKAKQAYYPLRLLRKFNVTF